MRRVGPLEAALDDRLKAHEQSLPKEWGGELGALEAGQVAEEVEPRTGFVRDSNVL
jgi:hypothetical protein